MTISNVEENTPSEPKPQKKTNKRSRIWIVLLGILLLILLAGVGAYAGYSEAMGERVAYQETQVSVNLDEQFQLAEADRLAGRLEIARRRYEYIITNNPNYPGAAEAMAQVVLKLSITNTPTVMPTITLTPTPDTRGAEALYNQAREYMANSDWENAFNTLESLRQEDDTYNTVDVDGMYFVTLQELGKNRIANGNLEMGLYTLALAERFGYLDPVALGLRQAARWYITGASFWEIDWKEASSWFEQVYQGYPNMMDVNKVTAKSRFRESTLKYGDQLAAADDYCDAAELYEKVIALGLDPTAEPTLEKYQDKCGNDDDDDNDSDDSDSSDGTSFKADSSGSNSSTPTPLQSDGKNSGATITETPTPPSVNE